MLTEEPQPFPAQFALAIFRTVAYNSKAAMKIGSCAILRREPGQVLTEAAVSVCWMCCGFAQSERYFLYLYRAKIVRKMFLAVHRSGNVYNRKNPVATGEEVWKQEAFKHGA